jgi:hypothetical protein
MRLPVNSPRRRRKRPDVATFVALMGLAGMIYLMEAEVPFEPSAVPTVEKATTPQRMRGLTRAVVDQSKEMNEFAVWVQEATNDIEDEVHRQRVSLAHLVSVFDLWLQYIRLRPSFVAHHIHLSYTAAASHSQDKVARMH